MPTKTINFKECLYNDKTLPSVQGQLLSLNSKKGSKYRMREISAQGCQSKSDCLEKNHGPQSSLIRIFSVYL